MEVGGGKARFGSKLFIIHALLWPSRLCCPPNHIYFKFPMVSATLVDSLKDPSGELLRLYRKLYSEGPPVDFPDVVSAHFSSVFPDDDALDQVRLSLSSW